MTVAHRPARPRRSQWLMLAAQVVAERSRLLPLAGALLLATLLPLAAPQLVARLVDQAIARAPLASLLTLAVAYLAVAVGAQAASVAASYAASGTAWRITNRLRERVAGHAMDLDMTFHSQRTPGEMIERVDGDLLGLTQFLSGFVAQAVGSVLLLGGTLVLVWRVDARIGALLGILVAAGLAVLAAAQRAVTPHAVSFREETARMLGSVEERLAGAEEIRANGAGRHVVSRFLEAAGRVLVAERRWQSRAGALLGGTSLMFALGTILLMAAGILLRQAGAVTVGTVVLLFQYAQMVRDPVERIVDQAKQLVQAGAAVARVSELLDERPEIVWPAAPRPLPAGPLSVRFAGVRFAYPGGAPVLHDVDLDLRAGRTLGLVGRTGSGKSTLARLALRLYDPTAGCVCLGGVDLRDAGRDELRRRTRMVTQDVHLFGGSLRDNVTLFDGSVPDDRVDLALERVGLAAWRRTLPDGLDTELGASGTGLSAGEAQLVALARAFLADPSLLVLDEASSRLDPATERTVREATARLLAGRTAIVIAHRMATLVGVDDVAVIDDGRIVEHGPRAELARDAGSRFAGMLAAAGQA
jgi:ABC-type multidrug transport system fused ATPase/permease subunit